MTNIINGIEVPIPHGKFNIPDDQTVMATDRIAHVSRASPTKMDHVLSWLVPDASEVGKLKKFAGLVVIRDVVVN